MGLVSATQDAAFEHALGANVERVSFDWRWAEPSQGQYSFGVYDQMYAAMQAQGIRPIWILLFAPSWASAVPCDQYTQNCMYPPAASHYADAAHMAALLATRYPNSAGIEIWNEENNHWFWPSPDPAAYTQLLKVSYSAVKQANPSMPVVLGGLSNVQQTAGGDVSLNDFLTGVYANGGKDSMDAIAFHPYPAGSDLSLVTQVFQQVRSIRHQFADDSKPLWATEIGLTTSGNMWPGVGDAAQAATLVAVYKLLSAMPDVKMIIFHTLIEYGSASDSEYGYGLMTPSFQPRPAFCALALLRGNVSCST